MMHWCSSEHLHLANQPNAGTYQVDNYCESVSAVAPVMLTKVNSADAV